MKTDSVAAIVTLVEWYLFMITIAIDCMKWRHYIFKYKQLRFGYIYMYIYINSNILYRPMVFRSRLINRIVFLPCHIAINVPINIDIDINKR